MYVLQSPPVVTSGSHPSLGHNMRYIRALVLLAAPVVSIAQTGRVNKYGNPPRMTPAPTSAAITARDLQIRLYQFADDSMQGRQVGRVGNMRGTTYIANEVK